MPRRFGHAGFVSLLLLLLVLAPVITQLSTARPGGPTEPKNTGFTAVGNASQVTRNPCVGTVTDRPNGTTLLSIQGARGGEKTAAMLVGIRPSGEVVGVHNDSANGRWWVYDIERLANDNLLLSTTEPGISIVEELNATTGEHVSTRRFPNVLDSHDADLINGDELLLNDMSRNGNDRVIVYNLSSEEIVWEYRFDDYPTAFPKEGGGEYGGDWTHNNDIDQIRPGVFMVSVRNFDQVVAIDRETKEIRWTLGNDDNRDILFEQHNPDYIEGENGTATVIVADSRNDRVVEYSRENDKWVRTWVLRGGGLNEPRDADRLPNGNTLVVDRRGDRLLEVTPQGDVVWEFYAPWQPYDAERIGTGDGSTAPTARQLNATGVHELTGSAGVDESRTEACYAYLTDWSGGSQLVPSEELATTQPADTDSTATASRTLGNNDNALKTPPSRLPDVPIVAGGILVILISTLLGLAATRRWRS
ncbi:MULTISPECIES: aryl-sulfate sulfotransferase [unclassified Haloferax]|jgi:hypothetical protein|uniref:aryl-sulfate sulfotransferase n=1 Tax=unclassified Haloferax TaxID=2625095 RepID=UPI002874D20E|nr:MULTISPECIES: aryl-sulfate sulfotransferase [unclassified Haloferax]MDS0241358.1 aryl-sulfate sulfotransferase [Haloferax sp. S2CR25]MDS0444479.1 aryl-sulfate sulfotransferase [Haloferax sp. S2CR25-2]